MLWHNTAEISYLVSEAMSHKMGSFSSPTRQHLHQSERLDDSSRDSIIGLASSFAQLLSRILPVTPRETDRLKVKRIAFFGYFGMGNFGNDGSLEAMLRLVAKVRPETQVLCVCPRPTNIAGRFGVPSIAINYRLKNQWLQRFDHLLMNVPREVMSIIWTIRHIKLLDVIVIPGTGILDDFGTRPKGMPYWLFRWCLLARIFGTKILFVSIGAGPIHHPLSRWLMKSAAEMAAYRSYRDEISREFMARIGSDVINDPVYPDVAFALPQPATLRKKKRNNEPLTVGIGVMSYNGWRGDKARDEAVYNAYLRKLKCFVSWLLAEGYRVRILMGDTSDQRAVNTLCQMIEQDGRSHPDLVAQSADSLLDIMEQIADTDLVVATRFHNIVCALKLGRPTLSIGYANKNSVLLAKMGLADFCQHIEQLDVNILIRQFQKLSDGRKDYERRIRIINSGFLELLQHQDAVLLSRYL